MNGRRFAKCDFRFDRAERTPEGYLQGIVPVTKCGVFPYRNIAEDGTWDGTWRQELRHPDDVHDPKSLETLKMCPAQVEHVAMVDTENIDSLKVGHLGSDYEIGPLPDGVVKIPIRVDSPRGLNAVESGIKELSLGYDLELEPAPPGASYLGRPYTHRQRNIRYNHVALTVKARLGPELRLDSADSVEGDSDSLNLQKEPQMKKFNIDGIEYDAAPEVVNHIAKLTKRIDTLEGEKEVAKDELEDLKKDKKKSEDTLQGKLDTALADKKKAEDSLLALEKDIPARAAAMAKDSAELLSVAQAVLAPADFVKTKGMDSAAIKVAVIKAKYPEVNLDGKSADYIESRLDSIREAVKDKGTNALAQNRLDALNGDDGLETPAGGFANADAARAKMMQRNADGYLAPECYGVAPVAGKK